MTKDILIYYIYLMICFSARKNLNFAFASDSISQKNTIDTHQINTAQYFRAGIKSDYLHNDSVDTYQISTIQYFKSGIKSANLHNQYISQKNAIDTHQLNIAQCSSTEKNTANLNKDYISQKIAIDANQINTTQCSSTEIDSVNLQIDNKQINDIKNNIISEVDSTYNKNSMLNSNIATLPNQFEQLVQVDECEKNQAIEKCNDTDCIKDVQTHDCGLLHYRKWWERREVNLLVNGELVTGTPIFIEKDTLRVINNDYSYFIPLEKVDYIRTKDGLQTSFSLINDKKN